MENQMDQMIVRLIQNLFHASVNTKQLVSNTAMFEKSYMSYNKEFWDKYADENEARYNEEFAKYTRDLATSLHCTSVLEIGCGTGIDLRLFPDTFQIHGIDLNDNALDIAKKKLPIVNFKKGSITDLPFEDSSIDFVHITKFMIRINLFFCFFKFFTIHYVFSSYSIHL